MIWSANVIARLAPGKVMLTIPDLYRDDPIGPVGSGVDAVEGDRVLVVDLKPAARVREFWVIGYKSMLGRWGAPYPHEHPLGQVIGLNDALAAKADAPGPWAPCAVTTRLSKVSGQDLAVRRTPLGTQLYGGRYQFPAAVARDTVMFTLPEGFDPPVPTLFNVPGMTSGATDYAAVSYQFEMQLDRTVTAREALPAGSWVNFNASFAF